MKKIHFYYNEYTHAWYADIKEHTEPENRMVAGADTFLDKVAGNELSDVIVTLSDMPTNIKYRLKRFAHNPAGAFYKVICKKDEKSPLSGHILWLCNVTHTVLGKHPKWINVSNVIPVVRQNVVKYIPEEQMSDDFKMLLSIDKFNV